MGCPHTHFSRGKKIRVVLQDGTEIIDKFLERASRYMVLEGQRIEISRVKSATIYREPRGRQ